MGGAADPQPNAGAVRAHPFDVLRAHHSSIQGAGSDLIRQTARQILGWRAEQLPGLRISNPDMAIGAIEQQNAERRVGDDGEEAFALPGEGEEELAERHRAGDPEGERQQGNSCQQGITGGAGAGAERGGKPVFEHGQPAVNGFHFEAGVFPARLLRMDAVSEAPQARDFRVSFRPDADSGAYIRRAPHAPEDENQIVNVFRTIAAGDEAAAGGIEIGMRLFQCEPRVTIAFGHAQSVLESGEPLIVPRLHVEFKEIDCVLLRLGIKPFAAHICPDAGKNADARPCREQQKANSDGEGRQNRCESAITHCFQHTPRRRGCAR